MIIKGAIFDMDGVVVDTVPIHFKAWKKMFEEYGKTFTFEDYQKKVDGIPRIDGARNILTDLSDEELQVAAEKKQTYFLKFLEEEPIPVFESTVSLIKEFRKKGIKIAIVSSSKNCPHIIDRVNLTNLFDAMITTNDITKGKPDPEIFLVAAKRLNVEPKNCIVFEDAILGVEAAKRAGMMCVGIDRHNISDQLKKADIIVKDIKEFDYTKLEEKE